MLDTFPQNIPLKTWQQSLRPGHILTFRFPVQGSDAIPKVRPCLVLDVFMRDGKRYVSLAYGTTSETSANRGYEIHVADGLGLQLSGLRKPTRFVAARRITVSLDHPDIVCNRAGTPIIGHLVGASFDRMNAVRARIQAIADMRREKLERRAAQRRRTPQQLSLF